MFELLWVNYSDAGRSDLFECNSHVPHPVPVKAEKQHSQYSWMWGSVVIGCSLGSYCSYWTRRRTDQQDPAGVGMQDPDSCRWDHLQWSSTRSCKAYNQPGCPSHKGDTCFHSWLYQRDDPALGRSLPSLIPMELAQWWMKQKTAWLLGLRKMFLERGPEDRLGSPGLTRQFLWSKLRVCDPVNCWFWPSCC